VSDRTREDPRLGNTAPIRGAVVTIDGGSRSGDRFALGELGSLTVGSGDAVDVQLDDDTVSRMHLRLSAGEQGVTVVDEGSRNGTWLDRTRVSRIVLTGSATITVGSVKLQIVIDEIASDVAVSPRTTFGDAIGVSTAMRRVFALLERAASTDVSVLLEGESGTGKEVLARGIHAHSPRSTGPYCTVDCGAIPPGLIESELFGHVRGAFTGAGSARTGLFEQAEGGTLFLDELGELPLDMQTKLLRFLETREVRPVGATQGRVIDVRIVAATNRNLAEEVRLGRFRQDLFYRVAIARARIPPLRDRVEDIEPIAISFYTRALHDPSARLPADVLSMLRAYGWPGNVRELSNVVQRHALLGYSGRAMFDDGAPVGSRSVGPSAGSDAAWSNMSFHDARQLVLTQFEERYLADTLARAGGVVSKAADLAGVARPSFHRMLTRLERRGRPIG
jgi:two-component system, NtrC family, nitrogen regulation response regulator GlnG